MSTLRLAVRPVQMGGMPGYARAVHARRVLFVEDEDSISEPLSDLLRLEGYEPLVARSVAEGLELAERADPDIVLLDLMLPDGSGRELCRELRSHSDVPIIMLTARGQLHERIVGLEIGADDYIVKPFDGAEVIARIAAILRRPRHVPVGIERDETVQEIGRLAIDRDARRVRVDGTELRLSRKEFDVLELLARHPGHVVRREELIAEVWDVNWWGPTRTLDVHIGTLRRKLSSAGVKAGLIQTVRAVGFRLSPAEDEPSH
jgi:two-component system, OmpR family, response regulator RegX3